MKKVKYLLAALVLVFSLSITVSCDAESLDIDEQNILDDQEITASGKDEEPDRD